MDEKKSSEQVFALWEQNGKVIHFHNCKLNGLLGSF